MTGCLAQTGFDALPWVLAAALLVLVGATVMALLARKRGRAATFVIILIAVALGAQLGGGTAAPADAATAAATATAAGCSANGGSGTGTSPGGTGPAASVSTAPTAAPTTTPAPGDAGSAFKSVPFSVANVPADGYVVTERLWGGNENNCVSATDPTDDRRVWGQGHPASTTTITGQMDWHLSYFGTCVYEPSYVVWQISFYIGDQLQESWKVHAIYIGSHFTDLPILPFPTPVPITGTLDGYFSQPPGDGSGSTVPLIEGFTDGVISGGNALRFAFAPPVTDAHTFAIPVSSTDSGTPRFASKQLIFESTDEGSCILSRDPSPGAGAGVAGPSTDAAAYTPTFTVVQQQGQACNPATVREGIQVTLSMHSGGSNLTEVASWRIETFGSDSLSTLTSTCTVDYVNTAVLSSASCAVVGGDSGDGDSVMQVSQVAPGSSPVKGWSLPVVSR